MEGERKLTKESTRIVRGLVTHIEEQEVRRDTTRALLHTATQPAPKTGSKTKLRDEKEVEGGAGR